MSIIFNMIINNVLVIYNHIITYIHIYSRVVLRMVVIKIMIATEVEIQLHDYIWIVVTSCHNHENYVLA